MKTQKRLSYSITVRTTPERVATLREVFSDKVNVIEQMDRYLHSLKNGQHDFQGGDILPAGQEFFSKGVYERYKKDFVDLAGKYGCSKSWLMRHFYVFVLCQFPKLVSESF